MKLREQKWLEGKVNGWAGKGLISQAQAREILGHEKETASTFSLNPAHLIAGLGGLCVALGVILVVAHNWERVPAWWRQFSFGLGILAVAWAFQRFEAKTWARHALASVWVFLPLAGIGLWGQVYQLSGDPVKPILVAWILGLPLAWLAQSGFAATLHLVLLVWALFLGLDTSTAPLGVEADELPRALAHLLAALLLWATGLWISLRRAPALVTGLVWASCLLYLGILPDIGGVFRIRDEGYWLMLASMPILFWCGLKAMGLPRANTEGLVAWAHGALLYGMTFAVWDNGRWPEMGPGFALVLAFGALAMLGLYFYGPDDQGAGQRRLFNAVLLAPWFLALLYWIEGPGFEPLRLFLANLAFAGTAAFWISNGIRRGHAKAVNRGVLMVALLVFTRFVDLFGTMLRSGVAFIVAGLGFVALAWAMERGRRRLLAMAKEARP